MAPSDAAPFERDLSDLIGELRTMPPDDAHAHAIHANAVTLLSMLPPSDGRDDYGHALVDIAPALAADVRRVCAGSGAVDTSPVWRPYPVDALGFRVGRYVTQVAEAIGCDPSMVALPVLACLAGAIGNRRAVRLKRGWTEPAIVWGAVVARSGSRKSPALSEVTLPLSRADTRAIEAELQRRDEYEAELERWGDAPRSERPVKPEPGERLMVSDITVEALADEPAWRAVQPPGA